MTRGVGIRRGWTVDKALYCCVLYTLVGKRVPYYDKGERTIRF